MAVVTRSMPCPVCGAATIVQETNGEGHVIRRIRWCKGPQLHKFVTKEVFERDVKPNRLRGQRVGGAVWRTRAPANA